MKSIIFALVLFFPTAITTTGFQLALTSKIINLTRSRTQTPPSTTEVVAVAPPSKPDSNNNKRSIIALATTSSSLLSIIHRPNVACATTATTIIPPSPLSSVSLIDPAILTTTEGLSVINSNNNKNLLSVLMTTFMSTIQMKQHSMAMFAIAVGMTAVLLKCAEGGYVKFVEFVAEQCLGYYGMNSVGGLRRHKRGVVVDEEETKKKKKKVDWNDYVLRLSRRRKEGAVDDDDKIVLDNKTMLFQQPAAKVAKDRYDNIMMERANQSYREKQYEQHHHDTDLSSTTSASDDLDTPSRSSWNKYKTTLDTLTQNQVEHDETSDKLQIMKNLLTWEDYKHLVSELQLKKEECSMLQEEVSSLKKLLQVERTVHSYHTPQVVVDSGSSDDDKELELKTLEDKAKEYDETIQQAKVKDGDSVRWH
ncbi:hypothetical protein QTG54_002688 [Skeletonema marinoi]|uniref:Uncharacterized protein n=1 Tax=Skeletonema marinoi TaxID=267567 RepID=A0AAD9DFR7_9STRA|nr:hypothetical protein QTG54_002688 [Skeletonema marinoi]